MQRVRYASTMGSQEKQGVSWKRLALFLFGVDFGVDFWAMLSPVDAFLYRYTDPATVDRTAQLFSPLPPCRQKAQTTHEALQKLGDNGVTLEVIAAQLGVTRERVRQIEAKVLAKCRKRCNRHGYRLEDLVRYL